MVGFLALPWPTRRQKRAWRRAMAMDEVETLTHMDYLDWLAYRWPDGALWGEA